MAPNRGNSGFLKSLPKTSASLPILLLKSVMGAPVSKTNVYGPLPLTLALTIMCWVLRSSNGTRIGLTCSWAVRELGRKKRAKAKIKPIPPRSHALRGNASFAALRRVRRLELPFGPQSGQACVPTQSVGTSGNEPLEQCSPRQSLD